eukprot:6188135-Pleurochrysis_carterae.AAC.8
MRGRVFSHARVHLTRTNVCKRGFHYLHSGKGLPDRLARLPSALPGLLANLQQSWLDVPLWALASAQLGNFIGRFLNFTQVLKHRFLHCRHRDHRHKRLLRPACPWVAFASAIAACVAKSHIAEFPRDCNLR